MALDFYALTRGEELPPLTLSVTADDVRAYLDATGEPAERWEDAAPPLALGAFMFGALMEQMPLPSGSIHTGQEFEFLRVVTPGEPLEASLQVAQRSERSGMVFVVFRYEMRTAAGPTLRGRTTVVAPARESQSS